MVVAGWEVEYLKAVHKINEELNDLNCCEILLPPEEFAHFREGGKSIVGVHDHVDGQIDVTGKDHHGRWFEFASEPDDDWDERMMEHMEHAEVAEFLAANEE